MYTLSLHCYDTILLDPYNIVWRKEAVLELARAEGHMLTDSPLTEISECHTLVWAFKMNSPRQFH